MSTLSVCLSFSAIMGSFSFYLALFRHWEVVKVGFGITALGLVGALVSWVLGI